jgi:hypothetical protein
VDGEALTLVPVVTIVLVLAVIDKKQKMITSKITEVRHDFLPEVTEVLTLDVVLVVDAVAVKVVARIRKKTREIYL